MRNFDYEEIAKQYIDNEIVNLLIKIHEKNVRLNYILESQKYDFEDFAKQAKLESIISSNRMKYSFFYEETVERILEKDSPVMAFEKEVCGYNLALSEIFKANRPHCVKDAFLLNKHFQQYDEDGKEFKQRYSNYGVDKRGKGGKLVLDFKPVDFELINEYLDLISPLSYSAMWNEQVDFLLVLPVCILDLFKIYPLDSNTEQITRLLMIAMLWAKLYRVCKYVSIERLIEDSSDEYYSAITQSLEHWEDGFNDYKPFVKYMLETILKAYQEFEERTVYIVVEPKSKPERVEQFIMDANREVIKRDIMHYCPDISETTIEITLRDLKNSGIIEKIGGGRYTKYKYKRT